MVRPGWGQNGFDKLPMIILAVELHLWPRPQRMQEMSSFLGTVVLSTVTPPSLKTLGPQLIEGYLGLMEVLLGATMQPNLISYGDLSITSHG